MTSSYNDIYSRFLNKIRDYEFAGLPESTATKQMLEWLQSAIGVPYIYRIFNTFSADDEIAEMITPYVMVQNQKPIANILMFLGGVAALIGGVVSGIFSFIKK